MPGPTSPRAAIPPAKGRPPQRPRGCWREGEGVSARHPPARVRPPKGPRVSGREAGAMSAEIPRLRPHCLAAAGIPRWPRPEALFGIADALGFDLDIRLVLSGRPDAAATPPQPPPRPPRA